MLNKRNTHKYWIVYQANTDDQNVKMEDETRQALIVLLQILNKEKLTLINYEIRKISYMHRFDENFLQICFDIMHISIEEQIERYTQEVRSFLERRNVTNITMQ